MHDVFISHNSADKPIARRVARRLHAYGINVWLDERELRLGDKLDTKISEHIQNSKLVLVIASRVAARSEWVDRELDFALSAEKTILPLFVENVIKEPLFGNYKGLDASNLHQFEDYILEIAEGLSGKPLKNPSRESLKKALGLLEREEPDIKLLMHGCFSGKGFSIAHLETVTQIPFHQLDFTLNAMFDVAESDQVKKVAYAAAFLFSKVGVGSYTISRYIATTGNTDGVLIEAVSCELNIQEIDTAIGLLEKSDPIHDQAFCGFIHKNHHKFSDRQKKTMVRLVIYPDRGPGGFGRDVAYAALLCEPNSEDLNQLWINWINDGLFDRYNDMPCQPDQLAYYLNLMFANEIACCEHLVNSLKQHIEYLLKELVSLKIESAIDHVFANSASSFLNRITVKDDDIGKDWGDSKQAIEMRSYVTTMLHSALKGEKQFIAYNKFKKKLELRKRFDAARRNN